MRWFVEHAFVLVPAQALVAQHLAELPAVPAAPEARQLLGRPGHGEAQEPAVQQLDSATSRVEHETDRTFLRHQPPRPALDVGAASGLVRTAPSRFRAGADATSGGLLPSWNDGAAKQAIFDFVRATIDRSSPNYVFPEDRIAVFDQDGTLWVEHPMYTQVVYCLERVPAVVAKKPELKNVEPFKTVLSGNREAMAKLSMRDLEKILAATLTGMTVEEFNAEAKKWIETAKHPRWKRPYTELAYQPMLEVLRYLRDNAYKTYIVTGGGQDFVRVYAERVYGIPPEQVVGTAGGTKYGYGKDGKPFLTKEPKLLLNDNNAGKPEGIHLMIGRRPYAAFGNSTGDRQMLEYTGAGAGARLKMLVLHDDAAREYAYGPAQGLPDTKVGTFTPGAVRRGEEERLDGHQHEERLEAHLRVRVASLEGIICHDRVAGDGSWLVPNRARGRDRSNS